MSLGDCGDDRRRSIDVGLLADSSWAVIEANPVFGAGVYAGDPSGILDTVLWCVIREVERGESVAPFRRPLTLD